MVVFSKLRNSIFKSTSFKQKIILSFIITFLVPFVLLFLTSTFIILSYFEKNAVNTLIEVATKEQYVINNRLNQIDTVSDSLTTYLAKTLLPNNSTKDYNSLLQLIQLKEFISNVQNNNRIKSIRIYSDFFPFITSDQVTLFSLNDFSHYKELNNIESYFEIGKLQAINLSEDYDLSFFRTIKNINGQIVATYFIDVYKSDFIKSNHTINNNINTSILSDESTLIYTEPVPETDSYIKFPNNAQIEYVKSKRNIYIQRDLNFNDWTLLVYSPTNYIYQVNSTLLFVFIFISFLSIILSFYIGLKFSNILFIRIHNFHSAILDFDLSNDSSNINFTNQLDSLVERTVKGDEIDVLIRAFSDLIKKSHLLIESNMGKKIAIQKYKYDVLQEQINPHFLYNTLDTIRASALLNQKETTCNLVNYLSNFYRISLSKGQSIITIKEEISMLTQYLKIEQVGYANQITWFLQLDSDIEYALIPKFTLQPIIENSIIHGKKNQLHINILIYKIDDNIIIEISDNGEGITHDKLDELRVILKNEYEIKNESNYGLQNINARLKLFFGNNYGLSIDNNKSKGVTTKVICAYKTSE